MWSNVGDGESVGGGVGVVILGEGGVVLEEVYSWNGISIDLTHQLDTPPSLQAQWNSQTKNSSWYWVGSWNYCNCIGSTPKSPKHKGPTSHINGDFGGGTTQYIE